MKKDQILKDVNNVKNYLKFLFESPTSRSEMSDRALDEEELQQKTRTAVSKLAEESSDEGLPPDESDKTEKPSPTPADDKDSSALAKGEVSVDDIIEKLNSIRSGKSFKDELINGALDSYVGQLTVAEKTALLAFLKGIAQIVTGEIPAERAAEPDKAPADVKMKKDVENKVDDKNVQKRSIKPNVIKRSTPQDQKSKKPEVEDRSAPVPVPITPKRK